MVDREGRLGTGRVVGRRLGTGRVALRRLGTGRVVGRELGRLQWSLLTV